jgi:hypothetical protein
MGSGTWTLTGTVTVWDLTTTTGLTFNSNTANIVLSDTSTFTRTFNGGGLSYNALTISGSTGISTLTLNAAGASFTEIASTKTVGHSISLASNLGTVGTWSAKGTAGNVLALYGSAAVRSFALTNSTLGLLDYLSVQNITITTPNKFYVGLNSTNLGGNTNVYFSDTVTANSNLFFGSSF